MYLFAILAFFLGALTFLLWKRTILKIYLDKDMFWFHDKPGNRVYPLFMVATARHRKSKCFGLILITPFAMLALRAKDKGQTPVPNA